MNIHRVKNSKEHTPVTPERRGEKKKIKHLIFAILGDKKLLLSLFLQTEAFFFFVSLQELSRCLLLKGRLLLHDIAPSLHSDGGSIQRQQRHKGWIYTWRPVRLIKCRHCPRPRCHNTLYEAKTFPQLQPRAIDFSPRSCGPPYWHFWHHLLEILSSSQRRSPHKTAAAAGGRRRSTGHVGALNKRRPSCQNGAESLSVGGLQPITLSTKVNGQEMRADKPDTADRCV